MHALFPEALWMSTAGNIWRHNQWRLNHLRMSGRTFAINWNKPVQMYWIGKRHLWNRQRDWDTSHAYYASALKWILKMPIRHFPIFIKPLMRQLKSVPIILIIFIWMQPLADNTAIVFMAIGVAHRFSALAVKPIAMPLTEPWHPPGNLMFVICMLKLMAALRWLSVKTN